MNLIIDYGNTNTKIYLFDNQEIIKKEIIKSSSAQEYLLNLDISSISNAIISTVVKNINIDVKFKRLKNFIILDQKTPIPIKNLYQTPESLGKDRLAAVVGANYLFPKKDILVIDAGTAITFDFINHNSEYLGGNISAGINMRFRALHDYTASLPLLNTESFLSVSLIGKTTEQAIINGVINSVLFEIKKYIEIFKQKFTKPIIVITGGDINILEKKINYNIFAEPNLVAIGLNRILNFNLTR